MDSTDCRQELADALQIIGQLHVDIGTIVDRVVAIGGTDSRDKHFNALIEKHKKAR